MICNKKAYPAMRKDCEKCSDKLSCWNGKCVEVAAAKLTEEISQPIMREKTRINVDGDFMTVYRDELIKKISEAVNPCALNFKV